MVLSLPFGTPAGKTSSGARGVVVVFTVSQGGIDLVVRRRPVVDNERGRSEMDKKVEVAPK